MDLHGPVYVYVRLDDAQTWALGLDARKRVALLPAASASSGGIGEAEAAVLLAGTDAAGARIASVDPSPESVYAVWVASRVAGSDAWNLRSADHTFLSCAPGGALTADAVSRGPLENWTPEPVDVHEPERGAVGLRLRTPQGTYLAASLSPETGRPILFTTSDPAAAVPEPGSGQLPPSHTHWHVRVQWKHRHFARAEHARANRTHPLPPASASAPQAGIVLSYGAASGSRGKYHSAEAAVDARAKSKSDKYAK